jgi:hypothetical protein
VLPFTGVVRLPKVSADTKNLVDKADKLAQRVSRQKHHEEDPLGPNIITHERVIKNITAKTPFGTFNVSFSELHQIRPQKGGGLEVVHMVDPPEGGHPFGSTGVETVLWRHPLPFLKGWRVEWQGPAIYTDGARATGVGVTHDEVDEKAKEAVSITIEFKWTHEDVARLASLAVPGAAIAIEEAMKSTASSEVANIVGGVLAGAVPVVSLLIAASTARWAYKTFKDPKASKFDKGMALAHAFADAMRVVFPWPGIIANVALVGVHLGVKWWQSHKKKKAEMAARQATAPPEAPQVVVKIENVQKDARTKDERGAGKGSAPIDGGDLIGPQGPTGMVAGGG